MKKAKRKKNRQRESNAAHRAKTKVERWAANDGHKYPKRICEQCCKPFWPSNGQEVLCSEECKTINHRQKQLTYYHRKQSGQKAGEAI